MTYTTVVLLLAAALVAVTLLPMTELQGWWIRAMAFPRIQLLAAAGVLVVLCLFLAPGFRTPALVVALACLGFQAWKIFPYTPLASKEIRLAPPADDQLRFLAANVLMENDRHDALVRMIQRESPDVVFLMETDQSWADALEPVLSAYDTVMARPQDNHYGFVFATNLQVVEAHILDLGDVDKPTLYAELKDRLDRTFRFVGLHPAPPVPGQDTKTRDAKTAYAARFALKSGVPVVIMGDFNQPAWSHFAQRFKHVGGYLDPRIGRGPLSSFDATHPILRFPIDQLYITPDIALVDFARGERIGSDHFPLLATLRIDPQVAAQFNARPPEMGSDEAEKVEKMIDAYGATLELDIRDR